MLLTAKQKLVWKMVRQQNLRQKDAAETLGMSRPALSQMLRRADGRLRKVADRLGGNVDTESLVALLN